MKKRSTLSNDIAPIRQHRNYFKICNGLCCIILLTTALIAGCKKDNFVAVQGVCPLVTTDPMDKAVNVILDKVIVATFNTDMDPSTITKTTFTIMQGATLVSGIVAPTSNGAAFTFTPTAPLLPFTLYTGTITTGATDKFHTSMVSNYVWSFTTIPQVKLTSNPIPGGVLSGAGTFAQGSAVTVSETPNTGYTFSNWTNNGTIVSKSSSYQFTMAGNVTLLANFAVVPAGNFAVNLSSNPAPGGTTIGEGSYSPGSSVTVTATPNKGYTFSSWTENGIIVSSSSSYKFTLTTNRKLVANFTVVSASQFAVVLSSTPPEGGTTAGNGAYNAGASVTVNATANIGYTFTNWTDNATGTILSTSAAYTFTLNTNRSLIANFIITPGIGPGQINLGEAADYTILTKAGISTTGITSIDGNIGVSPAAATSITGFGLIMNTNGQSSNTPIVTGSVFAADYAAPTPANLTTAVSDMQTAFTTANGLITPAPVVGLGAGNISGLTIPPGLYKFSTGVLITSAGVTLAGGPNDTWVFQISQDLIVNNSAVITLIGGAQAKNITWVVNGQATLGTNVNFSGNILSETLISLNTGTTVTGRLLAQTAVTLNASTVILP